MSTGTAHAVTAVGPVVDLVKCGIIKSPEIELSEALITASKLNETRYTRGIVHFKPNIEMPYYHIGGEPFWRFRPFFPAKRPAFMLYLPCAILQVDNDRPHLAIVKHICNLNSQESMVYSCIMTIMPIF